MIRILSRISLFLMPLVAYADDAPVSTDVSKSSEIGVAIFAVLFVGVCLGFVWYLWKSEKKRKLEEKEGKPKHHGAAPHKT